MIKIAVRRLIGILLVLMVVLGLTTTALGAGAQTVRLKTPDAYGSVPFSAENMFPGDAQTLPFNVKVRHKNAVILYFDIEIPTEYAKLAEVLMVKVEYPETGTVRYEGLMRDMPVQEYTVAVGEKEVCYNITAYLPTSVGNDYQNKPLKADFRWWYYDDVPSYGGGSSGGGETVESPGTGDSTPLGLYAALMSASTAVLIFMLYRRRQTKEVEG